MVQHVRGMSDGFLNVKIGKIGYGRAGTMDVWRRYRLPFASGPSRVGEAKLGNDLACTHMNNARTRSAVQSGAGGPRPAWGDKATGRLGYGVPSPPSPLRRASGGRTVSGYGESRKRTP